MDSIVYYNYYIGTSTSSFYNNNYVYDYNIVYNNYYKISNEKEKTKDSKKMEIE
jgi:hypothetical protein